MTYLETLADGLSTSSSLAIRDGNSALDRWYGAYGCAGQIGRPLPRLPDVATYFRELV